MFTVKNLTLRMKKDSRLLLEDFSFSFSDSRRKTALIGEEGNGKSTLLKCLCASELVSSYIDVRGEVNRRGELIGYLPQQLEARDLRKRTDEFFFENLPWTIPDNSLENPPWTPPSDSRENSAWTAADYSRFYRLLEECDFPEDRICPELKMADLSGGEKIKLQLLRILMREPTLLLLDEPGNDLDLSSMRWFEGFLLQQNAPILFISHDEELLENCSDSVVHLEQLQHKRKAFYSISGLGYREYVFDRENRISKQTQLARKEKEEFDAQMERYRRIYERVQHELRAVSRQDPQAGRNLKDKMHSVKSMGRRFEKQKENLRAKPDVESSIDLAFDVDIHIPANRRILDWRLDELKAGNRVLSRDLRLSIFGPEKICLVGRNGAGKTTLLHLLMTELKKQNIRYGYMPQEFSETMPPDIHAVDFLTREHTKEEHTRIRSYLGSIRFTPEEMFHPVASLSGGQRAKLFFAKMILDKSEFLILDEASRNLSPLSAPEIRQALRAFRGGILAVSHERKFIREVCDKIYRLEENGLWLTDAERYIEGASQ